jgi:valine dehydrogenase (NAD+)
LVRAELDVYAPCALGGALDDATVEALQAQVVCGGANNQLVVEGEGGTADALMARGITYAPDFLVNAGGVIQVSDELHGFNFARAKHRTSGIFEATASVLGLAADNAISPAVAANHLAEERIAQVGSNRIWLPTR